MIHVPVGTVREVQTKYIIIVHEFGHMLGLPDEYMGIQCTELSTQITLSSIAPDTVSRAVMAVTDPRLVRQQQAFAASLAQTGLNTPMFMPMSTDAGNCPDPGGYPEHHVLRT